MSRSFLIIGSLLACLAVVAGAFGAHALKEKLEPGNLQVFETAVRYQMYHALALLLLGALADRFTSSYLNYSGILFIAGIVLFSGSLYLLSTRQMLGIESWKFLGPVTPLGGLCLIAGWVFLLITVLKK